MKRVTLYAHDLANSMESILPPMAIRGFSLSQLESSLKARTTMLFASGKIVSTFGDKGLL
jgi:hypothetical protein